MKTIKINFDMDGTIADLYGVDNWLEMLINGDTTPYSIAQPLVRLSALQTKAIYIRSMKRIYMM